MVNDVQQEINSVSKELLELVAKHLEQNKIEILEAQKLAADFLKILPISSHEDLLNKLKDLGEKWEEAKEVYVEEISKDHDIKRDQVLNQMRDAIKQGNIESALAAAKSMKGPV